MKRCVFLLCLALLVPALSARAGKVVTDSLQSAILGTQVKYNVYLPDGYGQTEKLYPVVYLLHGFTFEKRRENIIPLAVIGGLLPLIHTHSFLALGVISAVYCVSDLIAVRGDHLRACRTAAVFVHVPSDFGKQHGQIPSELGK